MSHHIQNDVFAFLIVFKSPNMYVKFQVNKQQFPIKKKYDGDRCTPTHRKQLQGENMSVGIKLIELNFNVELQAIFQTLHFTNCYTYFF